MDENKTVLVESLIIWLQTFNTSSPCTTAEDLTTGAALSQALHQIDPSWFTDGWLARIKTDVDDNWRLKLNNLKKILQMVLEYYNEVLVQGLSDFPLPDVALAAEHSDPVELGRLLQLVLGCAVRCERKQEYIQIIMTLEESVQHVVMAAIQELLHRETVAPLGAELSGDVEQQLKKALEEVTSEKEALAQRCQELDQQVAILQEEHNSLLAENDVLTDRANQLDTFDDPNTPSGRKHSQLQQQLEVLQEENFRLEAAKDDYRIHCEELEKQLVEVQHRNDELTGLAEESRSLKDELDVLRNCSDRVVMLEASVETYKRKLENLGDLKRQMKLLEENNTIYMQNTVSLEEELRKANAARAQLETYKRQVQELHMKLSDETRRADNQDFEMKKLEEKYELVTKEKERIIVERDSLKEINEELRCTQAQQHQLSQAGMLPSRSPSHDNLAAELIPVEHREKFIRLQHENRMLRVQQEEFEREKIASLQAQLEDAHKSRSQLDTENRLSRQRVGELQQQVEDLQKALQSQAVKPDDSNLKRKLDAHMVQLNEAQDEILKKKELLEDLQPDNTQNSLKVDELMAALKKKDDDMRAMEERYKMYLEKARNVIRALDPKLNPATAEIQALRNQVADRDKQILNLERQCEQARLREYEEKLIVSAWYNKSLNFQKLAIESRLGGRAGSTLSSGQSFLSQQRQVSNAPRRALSISVPSTTAK
ncbi:protein Hook homolog 1-like isoform X2 [Corythoichthys intestinalis]|uniref:protein Hook homolog 1-like isoform X2 n=2 Tax=Corythoichthys intestinalis TaxID=161448 RepID=UPI0025A54BDB|nr:protein Hook homolog 1-like isoform X2 [Corythoichthys intestinalis]XP_061790428.1 protein Hook homolog 1-like isoform X2 [Nerophis lumbriciformis]